jgi:hypothetical protein
MPWRVLLVLGLLASVLLLQPALAGVTIDGIDYPDPLEKSNGSMVESVDDWERNRRPELLELFRREIYGRPLPTPSALTFSATVSEFPTVTRKLVSIRVTGPYGTASFTLRLFIPQGLSALPPVFLLIDHRSAVTDDPTQDAEFFPMLSITRRGYAAAAFDVAEVAPDDPAIYRSRLIDLFHPAGAILPDDAGRAIAAWAWAASRVADYLVTDPAVDGTRLAIVGHSRGGKTALLAGAEDTRFQLVVANDSGAAGAKLARRVNDGQQIRSLNTGFPHWFCGNFRRYNANAFALPVDQHELIALAAPRRVYIQSATDSPSSDPKGQLLGAIGAYPVYALHGLGTLGLAPEAWPTPTDTPFHGEAMGFHLRQGGHNLLRLDWALFMDFADRNLQARAQPVVVEARDPPAAKSSSPHLMLRAAQASDGTLANLKAGSVGEYVTYALPGLRAGVNYTVIVRARRSADAGVFRIYSQEHLDGAASPQGLVGGYDRYRPNPALTNLPPFSYRPNVSGTSYLRFEITGRNSANVSGLHAIGIDTINLTPIP